MRSKEFYGKLKEKMDEYVHFIYHLSRKFPKDELYGVTSQIRRATLSIILNFIEGFARRRKSVQLNFFEISYGSLKESKYSLYLSFAKNIFQRKNIIRALKWLMKLGHAFQLLLT
ncbi:MAG: four helix bundle protein [candidate division WOR-3 bacterium]